MVGTGRCRVHAGARTRWSQKRVEAPGGDFRLTGNGILPSALIVPGIVGAGACADQQTHDQPRMQAGAGRAIRLSAKWDLEEVSRGARFAGAALLRFVRSAQHRVIDLGSTGHEQNRSRSPCSVFSSTRPPWPSDFLNCWPPLAGRESPVKPCKDQRGPGRRVRMRECFTHPSSYLHLLYLSLLSSYLLS